VLYARIGTGIVSSGLARTAWSTLVRFSRPFGARRAVVLSFCGPVILILFARWHPLITTLAPHMAYAMIDIDPIGERSREPNVNSPMRPKDAPGAPSA
jgi:hypothetical protein